MAAKLILALVLTDIASHGLKAGQVLEASPDLVKALGGVGEVDPHKDAVAYARDNGAAVVRSSVELAAAERQATADALRVRIAELEGLHSAAADEATKTALAQELNARRSELDAFLV